MNCKKVLLRWKTKNLNGRLDLASLLTDITLLMILGITALGCLI